MPETMTVMGFVRFTVIPWKGFGRDYATSYGPFEESINNTYSFMSVFSNGAIISKGLPTSFSGQ
jgi:hypothetical protein